MNLGPHSFSLRQLQYVVAVAETLSFRKAAERCHVSQPSLSAQLAQLESVIEIRLFERDRRGVIVTTAGREIIERARAILRDTDDLVELARRTTDPLVGTLRIGVIPTISPYLLPRIMPALRKTYRRLTVMWIEDKTDVLLRGLAAGELDAALLALEGHIGDVERAVVGTDPFVLVTPSGHPLGKKKGPVLPGELRNASVLLLDDGHCFREQALAFCSTAKAHELEFRATSLSTLAQMVASGAGVTLLPRLAVSTETRRAELRTREFAEPAPARTIAIVWRKRSPLRAALRQIAVTTARHFDEPARDRRKRKRSKK